MNTPQGASEQDPLAIADTGAERVGIELVVVQRAAEMLTLVVHGLWTGPAPTVTTWARGEVVEASVMGSDDGGPARPYRVCVEIDVEDAAVLVVRGRGRSDEIVLADLGELALVCGADPLLAGVPTPFLHRRGDRVVLVEGEATPAAVRRSRITVVA